MVRPSIATVQRMSARRSPARPLVHAAACSVLGLLALAGCASTGPQAASTSSTGPAAAGVGAATCSYPTDGAPSKPVDPPATRKVPDQGTSTVTLQLDGQPVVLTLDRAQTPCTTNSFESLARQGWFTGTKCHRLVDQGIFVLQCGDPTGTGTGGPGYVFADELATAAKQEKTGQKGPDGTDVVVYPKGTLAMANRGPATNGSQFFIVWQDSPLPAAYTVFGHVDAKGLEQVQKIAAQGVAANNVAPNAPAMIEKVTLG